MLSKDMNIFELITNMSEQEIKEDIGSPEIHHQQSDTVVELITVGFSLVELLVVQQNLKADCYRKTLTLLN